VERGEGNLRRLASFCCREQEIGRDHGNSCSAPRKLGVRLVTSDGPGNKMITLLSISATAGVKTGMVKEIEPCVN
jgi:hypothetical protein